jgi:shikimate dehydrogenase
VLGAGGTARAAVYALTNAGAAVSIWNRTPDRASTLAGEFGAEQIAKPSDRAPDAAIVVNTTAAGMETDDARSVLDQLQLDLNALADGAVLVDYPYKSGGSSLTLFARESGVTVVDGLDLLVGQGALSFELWFGRSAPRDVMRAAIG